MKDTLQTIFTLSVIVLVIWAFIAAVQWLGSLWDGVIDNAYENELIVESRAPGLERKEIEIQWYVEDRFLWLTKDGIFLNNLPETGGLNHFRVFVRGRPVHSFDVHRTTGTQKIRYEFLLREDGPDLELQLKWEPFFYHDDAVRSAPYYERVNIKRSALPAPALPAPAR